MHLARAVDCRATIVYGGRELPSQSAIRAMKISQATRPVHRAGSTTIVPDSGPAWFSNTSEHVIEAVQRCASQHNQPLEIEHRLCDGRQKGFI